MPILLCRHCGNRSPHEEKLHESHLQVYDYIGDDPIPEYYETFVLECGTCHGISVAVGFRNEHSLGEPRAGEYPVVFPIGPDILPPRHTLAGSQPAIPATVLTVYNAAWPLSHTAPSAFANQIRRALEYVCQDKGATGATLYRQLEDLANRAVFPPELANVADLIRKVGNRGSHVSPQELDTWDAELLDQLFRSILRYVYLVPSHAQRMGERLDSV